MKSILMITGFLFLQFFCACNNETDRSNTFATTENDVDAGRNFIKHLLHGNLNEARSMLVQDSVNIQYFDAYERLYKSKITPEIKRGYREASINIQSVQQLNDSASIINYSNSFEKKTESIKVIRQNGEWKVDLKHTFPATGSTANPQ